MKKKMLFVLLSLVCALCLAFTACELSSSGNDDHTHVYDSYGFDGESHWLVCDCGDKAESESHTLENGICTVCGAVVEGTDNLMYTLGETMSGSSYYKVTGYDTTSTKIVIPSVYNNLPVKSMSLNLFQYNKVLTSVTIGASNISEGAFYYCTSLKNVTIADTVTEIDVNAFRNCTSLTNVVIPDSVTNVGNMVFYGCTSLTSATIGSGLSRTGDSFFYGCTSLTSVTLSDSLTGIGASTFNKCTSLTSITIPDSVNYMNGKAFSECTALTSVTFENTNGWYVVLSSTDKIDIASSDLSNTSTAATYLTDSYCNYAWYRSDN